MQVQKRNNNDKSSFFFKVLKGAERTEKMYLSIYGGDKKKNP